MREIDERAVVDTNVLIYDLFEDSLYHEEAASILDSLEQWIIPSIVLHELIWFFRGLKLGIERAYEAILQYISSEKSIVKPVLDRHIRKALNLILDEQISLSRYNDKLILAIALEEKAPIATFDEKLRKQAKKYSIPVLPEKINARQ